MLTRDEVLELSIKIQDMNTVLRNGSGLLFDSDLDTINLGSEAVNVLFNNNVGLVYSVAGRFKSFYGFLEYDDLVQEGFIGLHQAVIRFDGRISPVFSSFAITWITQYMNRAVNKTGRLIRLPENRILEYGRYCDLKNRAIDAGINVDSDFTKELGEEVFGNLDYKFLVERAMLPIKSFQEVIAGDDNDDRELGGVIVDNEPLLEDSVVDDLLFEKAIGYIDCLTDLEADIIKSTYEIGDFIKQSDIIRKYKIDSNTYRSILRKALISLKNLLVGNGFSRSDFF